MTYHWTIAFVLAAALGCDSESSTTGNNGGMSGSTYYASNSGGSTHTSASDTVSQTQQSLTATIESRSGSSATGTVVLHPTAEGVHVVITIAGASEGTHGIHFHAMGDCSAADATSAKDHYNPAQSAHGLPDAAEHHLGDMGNIAIAADGTGKLEVMLPNATLTPNEPNTLRGTAIILHEKADDGGQPAGNAGARIGCGVIPS